METIAIENGKLATELAKALLERKGYELIGGNWEAGRDGVVALDPDGTLVFVDASMSDPRAGGFEDVRIPRCSVEGWAFDWICEYCDDLPDRRVRFDFVQIRQTASGKGFARHTVNAFGSDD